MLSHISHQPLATFRLDPFLPAFHPTLPATTLLQAALSRSKRAWIGNIYNPSSQRRRNLRAVRRRTGAKDQGGQAYTQVVIATLKARRASPKGAEVHQSPGPPSLYTSRSRPPFKCATLRRSLPFYHENELEHGAPPLLPRLEAFWIRSEAQTGPKRNGYRPQKALRFTLRSSNQPLFLDLVKHLHGNTRKVPRDKDLSGVDPGHEYNWLRPRGRKITCTLINTRWIFLLTAFLILREVLLAVRVQKYLSKALSQSSEGDISSWWFHLQSELPPLFQYAMRRTR